MTKTFLVTGASGHLGRRAVELLLEANAGKVVATSRTPDKLADLAARGVEVRAASFDDPASLESAFKGVDRILLVSTDALHAPGLRIRQHQNAIAVAAGGGVEHVVYTSSTGPLPSAQGSLLDDHFWSEHALAATRLDWTILRENLYADTLLIVLPHAIATGQLYSATAGRGRSYVTRDDCARACVGALLSAKGRQVLELTGPAPVTQDEIAAIASELTGRPVAHVNVPQEDLREGILRSGMPPFIADALVRFDAAAAEGRHAIVTSAVSDLGGRAPASVRDYLVAHRSALMAG
jgi:NAD(P)H dehydrogenase (quinone)